MNRHPALSLRPLAALSSYGGRLGRGLLRGAAALVLAAWLGLFGAQAQAAGPSMRAADAAVELEAPPVVPAEWRTLEGLYARVHAHPDDLSTARTLAAHAAEAIPRIGDELGLPPGGVMDIYLTPTRATFDRLQPGTPPPWADGTAWPRRGLIFLHSPRVRSGTASPLTQVLDHEIAHIVLGRGFGPRPVPHWLQEGTAQLVAREYTPELTERLGAGVLGDSLLGLDQITRGFPLDPMRAQMAYAQSADFLAFLQNEYGRDAVQGVVFEMARGQTAEAALRGATGLTLSQLDRAWRGRLGQSGLLGLQTLVSDTALLGGTGFAFVVLGSLALRRRREQLEQMGRDDALHDALYETLSGDWGPLPPLERPPTAPRFGHPEPDRSDWVH